MTALDDLGLHVPIWTRPVEVPDPIPFDEDTVHSTYDRAWAERYWHILCQVEKVFDEFRARFTGKASPVQFYWGSFDLATTRYSGRPSDPPPNADTITRFSYTAEQSSLGCRVLAALAEAQAAGCPSIAKTVLTPSLNTVSSLSMSGSASSY